MHLLLLLAAFAEPPSSYVMVESGALFGTSAKTTVQRDGDRAVIEQAPASGPRMRGFYDLKNGKQWTIDPGDPSAPCSVGRFSGDWGDPFAFSASLLADLAKGKTSDGGKATVNGFATNALLQESAEGKMRVFREQKYGLIVRAEMTPAGGAAQTLFEVTSLAVQKPPPGALDLPASCKGVEPAPTNEERIAALTGTPLGTYLDAAQPPASKESCAIAVQVVAPKTFQPIAQGYTLTIDGKKVSRVDAAPEQMNVELNFPDGGATAGIYRQCPRGRLIFLVKDASHISAGGDWLWAK